MYCKKCGNMLNHNNNFCDKCGLKIDYQSSDITKINDNKLTKIWIVCAVGLAILSFVVLFSGVVIGVGSGYENPESTFDFAPFGISFVVINGLNIVFNIIMIFVKKTNKRGC